LDAYSRKTSELFNSEFCYGFILMIYFTMHLFYYAEHWTTSTRCLKPDWFGWKWKTLKEWGHWRPFEGNSGVYLFCTVMILSSCWMIQLSLTI
jgi:hypothetical protein